MISYSALQGQLDDLLQEPRPAAPPLTGNTPRISIVMPAYNSGAFIERSILSVLNQGWPNLELIVVDGGSSDDTVEIIRRYEADISFWCSERDAGQSDALNKGFARATGDIFGWLNADDLYFPGALQRAATALERDEKTVVYGDWLTIDADDCVTFRHTALPPSLPRLIADGFQFNLQSTFWKSRLHPRPAAFDIELHRTMDYDFAVTLLKRAGAGEIVVLPEPLGCFRRHADQKTQGFDEKVELEQRRIAQRHGFAWKYTWRVLPVRAYAKAVKAAEWLRRGAHQEWLRALSR